MRAEEGAWTRGASCNKAENEDYATAGVEAAIALYVTAPRGY